MVDLLSFLHNLFNFLTRGMLSLVFVAIAISSEEFLQRPYQPGNPNKMRKKNSLHSTVIEKFQPFSFTTIFSRKKKKMCENLLSLSSSLCTVCFCSSNKHNFLLVLIFRFSISKRRTMLLKTPPYQANRHFTMTLLGFLNSLFSFKKKNSFSMSYDCISNNFCCFKSFSAFSLILFYT